MASQNSKGKAPLISMDPFPNPSGYGAKIMVLRLNQETNPKPDSSSSSTLISSNLQAQQPPHPAIANKRSTYVCGRCDRTFKNIQALCGHQNAHKGGRRVVIQNRREVRPKNVRRFGRSPLISGLEKEAPPPGLVLSNRSPQDILNRVPVINRPCSHHPMHHFTPRLVAGSNHFGPGAFVAPSVSRFPHILPTGSVWGVPVNFMHHGSTPRFAATGNTAGSSGEGLPNFGSPLNAERMSNNLASGSETQRRRESSIDLSLRL